MAETLECRVEATEVGEQAPAEGLLRRGSVEDPESRLDAFLGELGRMTPEERIRASRYTMNRWEYWVYARRWPDEVPLINGELERIALDLE